MAVLAAESGMNSEENDRNSESSHKSNLHFDRQLQNKLLQIDEDSDTESYETKLSKSWSNVKGGAKSFKPDSRVEDITGWFPSAKFVARKPENAPKGESKPANTFIHPWRDYRSKKEESFVFRHYKEFRKYMEQYRNEHSCQPNRFSSGNQFGEMRRFAFQNSAPPQQTPVMVQQMHQPVHINSAPPSSINGNQSSIHYSTRGEQLGTLVTPSSNCSCNKQSANIGSSQPQRYGSIPSQYMRTNTNYDIRHMDSDNMSETGDLRHRAPSRRTSSASSTRSRSVTAKTPTKISVPASPNARAYPVQALTIAWRLQRQQNGKTEHPQTPKPLDNLNCVAPEKQMWFDASGRAYVSLATRYDPVRKY